MFGLPFLASPLARKLGLLVLAVAVFWLYGSYKDHQGYERGKAELQAKIDQFHKDMEDIKAMHKLDLEILEHAQSQVKSELSAKLDESEAKAARMADELKRAKTYVTAKADAACVLSAGAVSLWNLPLGPSGGADSGVPESRSADVDAPSGIALSDASAVIASNLSECVQRGEVIEAWQSWYAKNKDAWEHYRSKRVEAPAGP